MNQEHIGKFIAECRKQQDMTQRELAEKLGVTEKSVSNWENGRNMPDISLFKPLCRELDISINDLLSGEVIKKEDYQEKMEENIVNTINYSKSQIERKESEISTIIMVIGVLITISAFIMFDPESSWSSIYSSLGIVVFTIGFFKKLKIKSILKKLAISFLLFIGISLSFYIVDFVSVVSFNRPPMYRLLTSTNDKMIIYYSGFYNVYRINRNTPNEYYIIDAKKEYDEDTVPISPFNRSKSGIENTLKYKNNYLGNNSNTNNLISNLPLSEYGHALELDSNNLGIIINYHMTDWYIDNDLYLKQGLIYNSLSIFLLIDNVEYIKYNFSGSTYEINRKTIEQVYPNYLELDQNLSIGNFNKYVEKKINDIDFIENNFNKLFKI